MNRTSITMALACAWLGVCSGLVAEETNKNTSSIERIGIYDSRLIAYADFWSEAHQRKINDTAKKAKAAKDAGNSGEFKALDNELKQQQDRIHLQVFSTAPADDALTGLKARLPEIQKQAGVSKLVSKWDEKTLAQHKKAEKVDVTDLLLREFKLSEKQMKVVEDMKTKPPLPLDKAP